MNPTQLIAHFDRISDAPDAMSRLRKFVLDLAARGKLVEQDPDDEPAASLLRKLADAKSRLIVQKKLKKSNADAEPTTESELPFSLPQLWEKTRLGMVYDIRDGTHGTPKYVETGYPLITSKNLFTGRLSFHDVKLISKQDHLEIAKRSTVEKFDVLFAMIGSIGNPVIVDCDEEFSIKNVALFKYFDRHLSCPAFLRLYLQYAADEMRQIATGGLQPFVSLKFLRNYPIAIPPLAEQHRIVAKVDELMALCDRLEAAQGNRDERRDRLNRASLHRLNNGADADAFRDHARFHLRHLPRLTTRPEHIPQLRQTILNLAVRGKLVPQEPNDESVSVLLQRLSLLTANGGSVSKPLRPIDAEALPFDLPFAWEWVQAQDLCRPSSLITYGILKPVWVDVGVPTVRVQDMQDAIIVVKGVGQCSPERAAKFGKTTLEVGDLLIAKDGATLGKTAFVPRSLAGGNITQHVLRFPMTPHVNSSFIRLVIDSPHGQAWMRSETKGVALPGVNVGDFRRMPIPLPTLTEQLRIVAKVDELMKLCDQLESQLTTTQTETRRLLEAILHEALAPAK